MSETFKNDISKSEEVLAYSSLVQSCLGSYLSSFHLFQGKTQVLFLNLLLLVPDNLLDDLLLVWFIASLHIHLACSLVVFFHSLAQVCLHLQLLGLLCLIIGGLDIASSLLFSYFLFLS
jgi:hypothetical protein